MHYCDHCEKHANGARIPDLTAIRHIRSTPVEVHYEGLVCEHCGHELYDDETEAAITKEAIAIYRRQAKLLAPDALENLIKAFGPEELARRAHCSVSEIVNSAHGGVHSDQTDAALRKVMRSMATKVA